MPSTLKRARPQAVAALRQRPQVSGGNAVRLLAGGDELFPAMCEAIGRAQREVWMATYIFHDDEASRCVAQSLADAAARGVHVQLVVDGFGSKATLKTLRGLLEPRDRKSVV